mmetsp:Transcript_21045/g.62491  ORF Transcript_21045/g.62491 Transcript_21045/m.62491 type:complete len:104 (+) Transcript_21045:85-396(+)
MADHAKLGTCDAFISHSWHDTEDKWAKLCAWADAFYSRRGRWPNIWLDKFCIDQNNIDRSLAALPIYLTGCKSLVICAGPTYTRRCSRGWRVQSCTAKVESEQ